MSGLSNLVHASDSDGASTEVLDALRLCPNHNTALERVEGLRLNIPFGLARLRNRRSVPTSDVHSRHML